jgi:hypothetical protein
MKTLSTIAASTALGVDRKTLDNLLAREGRSLIGSGSRGRSRQIPIEAMEQIAVALVLNRDIGVSIEKGLGLAKVIAGAPTSPVPIGSLGTLTFDLPRLRKALAFSIDEALESVAEPSRGRPRGRV